MGIAPWTGTRLEHWRPLPNAEPAAWLEIERPIPAERLAAAARSAVNPVLRWAFYLFVFSIPFEMPNRSIPIEIPTLTGSLFLLATLINPSAAFRRIPAAWLSVVCYLGVLGTLVVVEGVGHSADLTKLFGNLLLLALVFWVSFNLLADRPTLRGFLLTFALACVIRAAIQVFGIAVTRSPVYGFSELPTGFRVSTFGQNPNLSAIILSAGMVVVLGLQAIPDRYFPRFGLLTWPLVALLAFAIIQGGSRGGLLCAGVGLVASAFRGRTRARQLWSGILALLAVAVLGWGALHSAAMRERIEESEAGQLAGRARIYSIAWDLIRERPLFGWGPVGNEYEVGRRLEDPRFVSRDTHNLVLATLTSAGLLGSLPFLLAIGLCVRGAWRARTGPLGILPLAVLAAVLTGTMSGSWMASKILWMALALGLAAGAYWSRPPATAAGGMG